MSHLGLSAYILDLLCYDQQFHRSAFLTTLLDNRLYSTEPTASFSSIFEVKTPAMWIMFNFKAWQTTQVADRLTLC